MPMVHSPHTLHQLVVVRDDDIRSGGYVCNICILFTTSSLPPRSPKAGVIAMDNVFSRSHSTRSSDNLVNVLNKYGKRFQFYTIWPNTYFWTNK